jgi:hypothetical protein
LKEASLKNPRKLTESNGLVRVIKIASHSFRAAKAMNINEDLPTDFKRREMTTTLQTLRNESTQNLEKPKTLASTCELKLS